MDISSVTILIVAALTLVFGAGNNSLKFGGFTRIGMGSALIGPISCKR